MKPAIGTVSAYIVGCSRSYCCSAVRCGRLSLPGSPSRDHAVRSIRKEFTIPAQPSKAVVRIVGLGHFELRVNGQRAGDAVIRQPWSQYNKTIYFEELDITALLHKGTNVLGVMLGNSFWVNPPAPAGQIP